MDPVDIISNYYDPGSKLFHILMQHNEHVLQKALDAASKVPHLEPDLIFIKEAALLHDIGIFKTDAPNLGCFGKHPYILHGDLGRMILEDIGLLPHALVCDRHMGVGMSKEEIAKNGLPLPARDMIPLSIEEQIISYADKFFTKNWEHIVIKNSVDKIINQLESYGGTGYSDKFKLWLEIFG
ncbi:MAG: HD domain-containing protein [Desulfobacterium sp.]|nr:HD domain-containing protein [Desulfobacterium sp.]MBU3947041.1 HD domain-containing protein [Pseudomonadota bacterium]MBU4010391.1 HD domain-containing protein [Pseudomonadota bacterium]MBU4036487.1 HD domain-containing protein [Pseudomonadota bacterium]